MKKLLLIPLVALLASCKSTHTSTLSTPVYAPKADINPIHADVDVDINKKLQGEAQASYLFFIRLNGDNKFAEGMSFSGNPLEPNKYSKLKSAAAYKAVVNSGSDVIVHPNFIIEKTNFLFFSTVRMKVSGYAGKFKKFYQCPVNCDKREDCKSCSRH
jgi:hypothetical protein